MTKKVISTKKMGTRTNTGYLNQGYASGVIKKNKNECTQIDGPNHVKKALLFEDTDVGYDINF